MGEELKAALVTARAFILFGMFQIACRFLVVGVGGKEYLSSFCR